MDLSEHLAIVWAKRLLILAVALAVAVAVFAWRSAAPERYTATTSVAVRVPQSGDPAGQTVYYAQTLTGLITSIGLVREALAATERTDDPEQAASEVSATAGISPGFVDVSGFGSTPQEAVELTDALVAALSREVAEQQATDAADERQTVVDAIEDLDGELAALPANDADGRSALLSERASLVGALDQLADSAVRWRVAVIDPALPPSSPSAPRPLRDALLALLVALILGAEAAVVLRLTKGRLSVRRPEAEAAELLGVPAVPLRPGDGPGSLAPLLAAVAGARVVTVVSIGRRRDARSGVLLAGLLAQRGEDVLLVDGTPASPSVHALTGVPLRPGLADLPHDRATVARRLAGLTSSRRLSVLTAGAGEPSPGALARVVETAPHDRVMVVLSATRLDDLISALSEIDGRLILVVDGQTATKAGLRRELASLEGLELGLVAATVEVAEPRGLTARLRAAVPARASRWIGEPAGTEASPTPGAQGSKSTTPREKRDSDASAEV